MRALIRYTLYALVAAALLVVALCYFAVASTRLDIYDSAGDVPHAQAALVLGASVMRNGTLSPVLEARADAAADLYKAGVVDKIVVTGDNSDVTHNEVNPTGTYLMGLGVPKEDIFLDHAGFDTYSSMYRAHEVFGLSSVVVVSQKFHLPRALFAAQQLGMEATGLVAPGEGELYNWVREAPAILKTYWDLYIDRQPQYLGEKVDITGDGSSSWE